jgi:hypothetical protein
MSRGSRICSEKLLEVFSGEAGLVKNCCQRPAFKVLVVEGQGNSEVGLVRMFKDVMAATGVVNKKPGPLHGPEDLSWPECGEPLAHTVSSTTLTFSFTGSSRIALSGGIDWPSFCILSK